MDVAASDPGGDFDIYRASSARDQSIGPVVKVSARLGDDGAFSTAHPDFDQYSIGSLTIWPGDKGAGPLGIQDDINHWVWWITGDVFHRDPRPWPDAS